MNEEILSEIKKMNKLLAIDLTRELKTDEKFELLSNAGFQPKEIADICNTTPNTVSVALSRAKSKRKKKGK
ncbi:MAG: hypothetical protein QY331_06355 [Melioribacteraceae bacterium]|nr:MAG: hypothetical protein QY331_06355 [Melioribacteraceae bacterium]